jgi:CRISPR/Cas system Type II protein with McrA/HNH and RuvC-like nuclease domain
MFHCENDLLANLIALSPKSARKKFRESIFEAWGWKCAYCEKELCKHTATIDHIVPKHKGGHSTRNNLACCCSSCNNAKSSALPFDWLKEGHPLYSEEKVSRIKQWLEQKPKTIVLTTSQPQLLVHG